MILLKLNESNFMEDISKISYLVNEKNMVITKINNSEVTLFCEKIENCYDCLYEIIKNVDVEILKIHIILKNYLINKLPYLMEKKKLKDEIILNYIDYEIDINEQELEYQNISLFINIIHKLAKIKE